MLFSKDGSERATLQTLYVMYPSQVVPKYEVGCLQITRVICLAGVGQEYRSELGIVN